MARAAEVAELDLADLERFAELYASSSPAVVRCGWGLERNRNGGSAVAAVLALPAVAGKFGVRGGGFTMSNATALGIKAATWMNDTPEPNTRIVNMNKLGDALVDYSDPRVEMLFVYNCNPLATMPHQNRVLEGLRRSDLFTVVFDQVVTDTARFADVLLPATTFVENYDIAKGYGPISLQLVRPVIEPTGESRSNPTVFADLANRLGLGNAEEEIETLLKIAQRLPAGIGAELMERGAATPPFNGRPVQFVDVFPLTPDGKIHLFPEALDREAPIRALRIPARPCNGAVPARAHFSSQRKDRFVDARRAAPAPGHAADAPLGRQSAGTRHRRPRASLQRARRSSVSSRRHHERAAGNRQPFEGPVAEEHLQRVDGERARARHAHRPRRRRLLQRRTGPGHTARTALTSLPASPQHRQPPEPRGLLRTSTCHWESLSPQSTLSPQRNNLALRCSASSAVRGFLGSEEG